MHKKKHFFNKNKRYTVLLLGGGFLLLINILLAGMVLKEISADSSQDNLVSDAQRVVALCGGEQAWNNCYAQSMSAQAKKSSLDYTLQLLSKIEGFDNRVRDCHVIAHKLISEEVTKNPDKWEELLNKVDPYLCNYGFIHGIIEARSRIDSNFVLDGPSVSDFCKRMLEKKQQKGIDQSCSHIMGHILLVQTNVSIPDAVSICNNVVSQYQRECNSGIFMETFTRENVVAHELGQYIPWNDETIANQEKICSQQQGYSALGCWQEISHLYNHRARFNPEVVYKDCMKAPQEDSRIACYQHGVATLIQNPRPNDAYFISLCSPYSQDEGKYKSCMVVIIRTLLNSSLSFTERAISYCSPLDSRDKRNCFAIIHDVLSERMDIKARENICKNIPDSTMRAICTSGGEKK